MKAVIPSVKMVPLSGWIFRWSRSVNPLKSITARSEATRGLDYAVELSRIAFESVSDVDAGDVRPVNEGGYVPAFNLSGAQQPDNTCRPTRKSSSSEARRG